MCVHVLHTACRLSTRRLPFDGWSSHSLLCFFFLLLFFFNFFSTFYRYILLFLLCITLSSVYRARYSLICIYICICYLSCHRSVKVEIHACRISHVVYTHAYTFYICIINIYKYVFVYTFIICIYIFYIKLVSTCQFPVSI